MSIQRFKAILTTGYWRDNPEPLVRDPDGDYVRYEDAAALIKEALAWNWFETIPSDIVAKFEQFM